MLSRVGRVASRHVRWHSGLGALLREEIEGEKANLGMGEEVAGLMASLEKRGSTITHVAGSGRVEIKLQAGVVASFDCREIEPREDDDNEDGAMEFEVKVTSDGDQLIFNCLAGDGVEIDAVSFYRATDDDTDKNVYDGPKFDELDPRVQAAFYTYLDERGVDPELCQFIHHFAPYKENTEYVAWLGNVEAFVSKQEKSSL